MAKSRKKEKNRQKQNKPVKQEETGGCSSLLIVTVLIIAVIVVLIINVTSNNDKRSELAAVQTELSEAQAALNETLAQEDFDHLTGVYTPDAFLDAADKAVKLTDAAKALYLISFDSGELGNDLNEVIETNGHLYGSEAIRQFAATIESVFSDDRYLVGRSEGGNFLILDTKYQGQEESDETVNAMKAAWHDTPLQLFDDFTMESPSLHIRVMVFEDGDALKIDDVTAAIDAANEALTADPPTSDYTVKYDGDEGLATE